MARWNPQIIALAKERGVWHQMWRWADSMKKSWLRRHEGELTKKVRNEITDRSKREAIKKFLGIDAIAVYFDGKKEPVVIENEDTGEQEVKDKTEAAWDRLLKSAKGKKATTKEETTWVIANIKSKPEGLKADEVPTEWCVSTLRWAQQSPVNETIIMGKSWQNATGKKDDEGGPSDMPTEDENTASILNTIARVEKAGKGK